MVAMMAAAAGFAAGAVCGAAAAGMVGWRRRRVRCEPLKPEELLRVSELVGDGCPVTGAVRHICAAAEEAARNDVANGDPRVNGYAFAMARAAGVMAGAAMVRDLWERLVDKRLVEAERRAMRERAKEDGRGKRVEQ